MVASDQDTQSDVNGKSVQDRLVEAAEELFCQRGFNETSVRDIAAAAGCNVASINYYFGGKENLYLEIWRRRLSQIRNARLASIEKVMSVGDRPQLEDLLRSYANSFLEPLVDGSTHCRFVNLMAREMIDPHLPREIFLAEMVAPVMGAMGKALLQICPWLNEGNVRLIILSVVGQLMHSVCAKGMFEQSDHAELPALELEGLVEHIVKFSAAGIRGFAEQAGG